TVEVPAALADIPPPVPSSRRPLSLPSVLRIPERISDQVPDARGPVAATPFTEAVTPAMGSPRFTAEAEVEPEADVEPELVLEDSHLEPYESPRDLEVAPISAPSAAE